MWVSFEGSLQRGGKGWNKWKRDVRVFDEENFRGGKESW